ncbi:MAG: hypothetical protein VX834_05475 [Myxococcota bacterium]|nr:hypothetical protein [Myxococcota bacterium]
MRLLGLYAGIMVHGLILAAAIPAHAGFDWGTACSSGDGNFQQYIGHFANIEIGEIPAHKANVTIELSSNEDVDVRLIDQETGHQIISWPQGDLNGPDEACTTYEGVEYCYSGYNGDGVNLGHEWIRVNGITNRPLVMSAFGYHAGPAEVTYTYEAPEGCVDAGAGEFAQWVSQELILTVGEIPAGKTNVDIALTARQGRDIDIQLWDGDTPIVVWSPVGDHGLINGPDQATIDYEGLTITYSGYNGRNDNWGEEDIRISGTLPRALTMKVFGYQSGFADVTYSWGHGQLGESCGGRTLIPSHPCQAPTVCKGSGLAVDLPGTCQPAEWCESDLTVEVDCGQLMHVATPGSWSCEENTCAWNTIIPSTPVISLADLIANVETYQHQLVRVTDTVSLGVPFCTKMFCSEENPCCNNCSSSLEFTHEDTSVRLAGLNCGGNECTYQDNCPYADGATVSVMGFVRAHTFEDFTNIRIDVTSSELFEN